MLGVAGEAAAVPVTYVPGGAQDPAIREARFLGPAGRHEAAIAGLLARQTQPGFAPSGPYWTALGDALLAAGSIGRAEAAYRQADGLRGADRAAIDLRLASAWYRHGYAAQALRCLSAAREHLPPAQAADWADLQARALMAQGRYAEAVDVLDAVPVRQDRHGVLRFNLATAMLASGRTADGRATLERVGRLAGDDALSAALRDRANLVLGWMLLRERLGGAARPVLLRIGSDGAYATRAWLGLGWAEFAPAGAAATRAELGIEPQSSGRLRSDPADPMSSLSPLGVLMRNVPLDVPADRRGKAFRLTDAGTPDDAVAGPRRALAIWNALADRDPDDPAVQEAWLAVPFALDKLGAHAEAVRHYEQAAQRLDSAARRVEALLAAVRAGRVLAGFDGAARPGLSIGAYAGFMSDAWAERGFHRAFEDGRDLRRIDNGLDEGGAALARLTQATAAAVRREGVAKTEWMPAAGRTLRLAPALFTPLRLQGSDSFGVPAAPLPLRMSERLAPADSTMRARILRQRLDRLRELLDTVRDAHARHSRERTLAVLDGRRKQIARYRAEAHFALARLHDRGVPLPDQDEFDLDRLAP